MHDLCSLEEGGGGVWVAGSFIFIFVKEEIRHSVCSLQRLAPLLLLLIASGTGVGNGKDKLPTSIYTYIIIFNTEVSPLQVRKKLDLY